MAQQLRLQSLLAYLVMHRDSPQARQHLAFLFWPDASEAQARANLRKALYELRQVTARPRSLCADRGSILAVAQFDSHDPRCGALSPPA